MRDQGAGRFLVHVDRHLLHDLSSPQAFSGLRAAGRKVRSPDLTLAVPDHVVETSSGRAGSTAAAGDMIAALRKNAREAGIRIFDLNDDRQGIVHVTAAEQGFVMPGMTVACGDSHTCTLGALGAWAFGVGTSEIEHILATQTVLMRKPPSSRLTVTGQRARGVTAKDLALGIIGRIGVNAAQGGVLEYAGPAITDLSMEERFTVCNMGIEAGARSALIATDQTTYQYVAARPECPRDLDEAVAAWERLRTDEGAAFDREFHVNCEQIAPQITWGTNPGQTIDIDSAVPLLDGTMPANLREAAVRALQYMDLAPGQQLVRLPIQKVFIGSCTNSRISDLEAAAEVVRGRTVARGVRALVVPGSSSIKRVAEERGIHKVFLEAGFEWRESGCSMCIGMNSDRVAAGERCVSTSNRNFEGRQGNGARTHLASPATAAASAIAGSIADPREVGGL